MFCLLACVSELTFVRSHFIAHRSASSIGGSALSQLVSPAHTQHTNFCACHCVACTWSRSLRLYDIIIFLSGCACGVCFIYTEPSCVCYFFCGRARFPSSYFFPPLLRSWFCHPLVLRTVLEFEFYSYFALTLAPLRCAYCSRRAALLP